MGTNKSPNISPLGASKQGKKHEKKHFIKYYHAHASAKLQYVTSGYYANLALSHKISTLKNQKKYVKVKLTARASDTCSRCFVKFETAFAILLFVTYIRSENESP